MQLEQVVTAACANAEILFHKEAAEAKNLSLLEVHFICDPALSIDSD